VFRPSFVVTKRGCIERKARAVLKKSAEKPVEAGHPPHIGQKELYVLLSLQNISMTVSNL
jgi:hypothetical protein